MRNTITLLLLFITISTNAQVWIDQNANWHYEYFNIASSGYYNIKYVQDTIVGGQPCQQIEQTQYVFPYGGLPEDTVSFATQYTYVNTDTVFYWRNNQFFTLFNFGASIGDQWLIGISDPHAGDFSCQDSSYVEVIDTGSIVINAVNYRTITLTTVENSSIGLEGTFVERFGFLDSDVPITPFPRFMNCNDSIIFEWDHVTFQCFEDDSFTLYNPSGEDCGRTTTSTNDQSSSLIQFQLFPNPVTNFINVVSDEPGTLMLLNYTGKILGSYNVSQSEMIDLSSFSNGLYIISFQSKSGIFISKRVLKIN